MSVESVVSKIIAALRVLHDALRGTKVRWGVMGSLSHALQGLDIQPNDIDICTDRRGAYEIERFLEGYVTSPVSHSEGDGVRSHLGELDILGVKVQIIGDMETHSKEGGWAPLPDAEHVTLQVEGLSIPVHSLEFEVEVYRRLNRMERVQRLGELIEMKKEMA